MQVILELIPSKKKNPKTFFISRVKEKGRLENCKQHFALSYTTMHISNCKARDSSAQCSYAPTPAFSCCSNRHISEHTKNILKATLTINIHHKQRKLLY